MPRNLLLLGCLLAALLPSSATSQQDKQLPFVGPAPPEELQVLAPLVGQWTTKWKFGPTLKNKEGYTATGESTGEWLHNRHILRLEAKNAGKKYRETATVLYGYDAKKKVYRRWLFSSSGLATESEGRWNADKRTMTWMALNLPPNVQGSITDVLGDNTVKTTVHFETNDGQVFADVVVEATRKKASAD